MYNYLKESAPVVEAVLSVYLLPLFILVSIVPVPGLVPVAPTLSELPVGMSASLSWLLQDAIEKDNAAKISSCFINLDFKLYISFNNLSLYKWNRNAINYHERIVPGAHPYKAS